MRFVDEISSENRCFGILHVRLATIIIGVWEIVANIIIVSIFSYLILFNSFLTPLLKSRIDEVINCISLGQRRNFIFNIREKYVFDNTAKPGLLKNYEHNDSLAISQKVLLISNTLQDYYLALFISICTISFCVMMIFGTIKRKPTHLMPYFCVEVFYFVMNSLTLIGEFSSVPVQHDIDKANVHTTYFNWSNSHIRRRENVLSFIQGLLLLSLNLYLLNVIWCCYKFLLRVLKGLELDCGYSFVNGFFHTPLWLIKLRRTITLRRRTGPFRDDETAQETVFLLSDENDRNYLSNQALEEIESERLPKYEDLLLMPANDNMPPPYYATDARPQYKK